MYTSVIDVFYWYNFYIYGPIDMKQILKVKLSKAQDINKKHIQIGNLFRD